MPFSRNITNFSFNINRNTLYTEEQTWKVFFFIWQKTKQAFFLYQTGTWNFSIMETCLYCYTSALFGWDALRDWVPFVQFKKRKKHPLWSVMPATKSSTPPWVFPRRRHTMSYRRWIFFFFFFYLLFKVDIQNN